LILQVIENSYVKTKHCFHTLHGIKATGTQPLESFKDLHIKEEYQNCIMNPMKAKTWYPLMEEVFVSFLFWIITPFFAIVIVTVET
jgi:hypothetical protein